MSESEKKTRRTTSTWVVQMRKTEPGAKSWDDIDMIDVPAGTKRSTVLEKARTLDLGLEVGEKATIRLLPYEHVREEYVEMVASPPTLKLAGPGLAP